MPLLKLPVDCLLNIFSHLTREEVYEFLRNIVGEDTDKLLEHAKYICKNYKCGLLRMGDGRGTDPRHNKIFIYGLVHRWKIFGIHQ